jgi:5'-deoxynucleotidase YfbR-like HD superfamily hydrolase
MRGNSHIANKQSIDQNNNNNTGSIQTFRGKKFHPLDPKLDEICIEDIAHALANKCRFSGHTSKFFSVAQHSVIVSKLCPKQDRLWGLLHDASEAYLVDMPKPLKVLPEFKWFVEVENKVQKVICEFFGLAPEQPISVHQADVISLVTEKRDLMTFDHDWQKKYKELPLEEILVPWSPKKAKRKFLERFEKLILKKK